MCTDKEETMQYLVDASAAILTGWWQALVSIFLNLTLFPLRELWTLAHKVIDQV